MSAAAPKREVRAPTAARAKGRGLLASAQALRQDIQRSVGQPLPSTTRERMQASDWSPDLAGASASHARLEAKADAAHSQGQGTGRKTFNGFALGPDFGSIRVHSDDAAARAAARLRAQAFTWADHVYLGRGVVSETLLPHELAHSLQQRALGRKFLQPRLIATGSTADIDRFIALAEPAMGEDLEHDTATGEINAVASLNTPPTSPAFASAMHRVMDDPAQDAEANFSTAQAGVAVGAFPQPADMTGPTQQLIDIDDVEAIETGAPGNGLGKLAHELTENYEAHGVVAVAGVSQFGAAHSTAVEAESDVAEDTVGPGRRVAGVDTPVVANAFTRIQDFENYYLVFTLTRNPANNDFSVSNARRAPRQNLLTVTIDGFATGADAVPPAMAAIPAVAAVTALASTSATVRIEGFTDDSGTAAQNLALSRRRAQQVRNAMTAAGLGGGRIHTVGRSTTPAVAPNDSEANRARNRRVVIIVDQPGP